MKTLNWFTTLAVTSMVLWAPTLAPAQVADVVLYETTENMKLTKGMTRRAATSALLGFAKAGTPLCPGAPGDPPCTVNVTATDNVSLITGVGPVSGDVTVVVQEPGSVDSPEVVVTQGKFSGTIDFTPILFDGDAFGSINATLTIHKSKVPSLEKSKVSFNGAFRVPFRCVEAITAAVLAALGLPPDTPPEQVLGFLGIPADAHCYQVPGGFQPVQDNEYAIGFPTVRFEINF